MHRAGIAAKALGALAVAFLIVSIVTVVALITLAVLLGKGYGP